MSVLDAYVGEIRVFACGQAPRGWAVCDGSVLPIASRPQLFSLLGNRFGGDAVTTFGLPNLGGRCAVGVNGPHGNPNLSQRPLAQTGGQKAVTLVQSQMPSHTHAAQCAMSGSVADPTGAVWTTSPGRTPPPLYAAAPDATVMAGGAIRAGDGAGQDKPHNNMAPYLGLNFCIALEGLQP